MLRDLDTQSRAVERDSRSPGGKGFTGLQALLGYVFNQGLAINTFGPYGHVLAVDAFYDKECSPYATPATIALALKQYGPSYRHCYAWLGPNQPGVSTPDPSAPGAPIPDPGGAPPGQRGIPTNAPRLTAACGDGRDCGHGGDQHLRRHGGVDARSEPEQRRRPVDRAGRHRNGNLAGHLRRNGRIQLGDLERLRGNRLRELEWHRKLSSGPPQLPARAMSEPIRRSQPSAIANPVLVGAMTVLVIMVAVFLAYNANNGLPFVPTKQLRVNIASGADLVVGNEVREGGFRVGLVSSMKPIQLKTGQIGAQLTLQLNQGEGNVPVDSSVSIRPRSVLGLKFVDLHKGVSRRVFADGATMPITQTSVPVQFEDVFQTFDAKTRSSIDKNLVGFGDTLAGRGSALNDTFASLPKLLGYLRPVAAYLADPNTQLTRLFKSLEGFMGTLAPVAGTNARLFTDLATTFEGFSRDPNALQQTIARSPSTEQVSTQSLKVQQPFLTDLAVLGTNLAPATHELAVSLPTVNPAIEIGTHTLARTPSLNANLQQVLRGLQNLALAPGTNMAVNALASTSTTLNPMIRYLGPYQTVCDDWNYFWTYLGEHLSQPTDYGFAQRALVNATNAGQPNNLGQAGAIAPVNGGGTTSLVTGGNEFVHGQAYGAAVDTAGNADCETGQRGYVKKLNYYDPQGRMLGHGHPYAG